MTLRVGLGGDPRVRVAICQWPPDAPRRAMTTFCAEHGISRKTFYAIPQQVVEDGPAAALARIFRDAGVARAEPKKKSRAAFRRLVYPAPNACRQLDATEYV